MIRKVFINKTGLQPVSRPVEQILGFFPRVKKLYKITNVFKTLPSLLEKKFRKSKPVTDLILK